MNPILILIVVAIISLLLAVKFIDKASYWRRQYHKAIQKHVKEQHELQAKIQVLEVRRANV